MGRPEDVNLKGLVVLVTRPEEQAGALIAAIEQCGGVAISFPLFAIKACSSRPAVLDKLDRFDVMIFISPNAVNYAWSYFDWGIPERVKLAAIGQATANALQEKGQPVDYLPVTSFDSEGLLALEAFHDMQGKNVLIVRGQGGRELLAETLRQRGANVEYAEVYQRIKTEQALTNKHADSEAIVVTSSEAMRVLAEHARNDQQDWVFDKPIVVIHPRIAMQARELGFTLNPVITKQQRDQSLEYVVVDALESIQSSCKKS